MMKSAHVWERKRNAAKARIKWMFTTDKARAKMGRAYPELGKHLPAPALLARLTPIASTVPIPDPELEGAGAVTPGLNKNQNNQTRGGKPAEPAVVLPPSWMHRI